MHYLILFLAIKTRFLYLILQLSKFSHNYIKSDLGNLNFSSKISHNYIKSDLGNPNFNSTTVFS